MKKLLVIGLALALSFGSVSFAKRLPPGCTSVGGQVVCTNWQSPF